MKWTHLPVTGGLYAQHPKLLDEWQFIFQRRAEHEIQKQRQEESNKSKTTGGSRVRKGRRR